MNDSMIEDDKRARLLTDALRDLPPRTAPTSLEIRVLAELQRRAALPWWRSSFMHWPRLARSGFMLTCGLLAGLTLWTHPWLSAGANVANESGHWALSWAHPLLTLVASAGGLANVLSRAIPQEWIYLALTAGAVLYAVLFGLGAAAYRTLYFHAVDEVES